MFRQKRTSIRAAILLISTAVITSQALARDGGFGGPDAVPNQLARDELSWGEFKEGLAQDGIRFTVDYSAVGFAADDSLDGADDSASGGMLRFYGQWDVIGVGEKNTGSLIWKIEHRHAYSDTEPKNFLFGAGAAGLETPPFSDLPTLHSAPVRPPSRCPATRRSVSPAPPCWAISSL
jgi:porin